MCPQTIYIYIYVCNRKALEFDAVAVWAKPGLHIESRGGDVSCAWSGQDLIYEQLKQMRNTRLIAEFPLDVSLDGAHKMNEDAHTFHNKFYSILRTDTTLDH